MASEKYRSGRSCIAADSAYVTVIGMPGFGPVRNKIAVLRIGLPVRGGGFPSDAYPPSGPCGGGAAAAPRATPGGQHKG